MSARVAVAEVQRRVAGQHVEVAAALDVVHPDALAAAQDDGQRLVVVRAVAALGLDSQSGFGVHSHRARERNGAAGAPSAAQVGARERVRLTVLAEIAHCDRRRRLPPFRITGRARVPALSRVAGRASPRATPSVSARVDRFVVIAEDLGEDVLLLGLDHRLLPIRTREGLQSVDRPPVGDDDELGYSLQRLFPAVTCVQPSWAFTIGTHRLDHKALELILLPRVDADTKDTNDDDFPPRTRIQWILCASPAPHLAGGRYQFSSSAASVAGSIVSPAASLASVLSLLALSDGSLLLQSKVTRAEGFLNRADALEAAEEIAS